jgi:hypothetical protein
MSAPLAGPSNLIPPAPGQYVMTDPTPFGYTPSPPPTATSIPAGYGSPSDGPPTPATREADYRSLGYLLTAAEVWLATGVVSFVLLSGTNSFVSVDSSTSPATFTFSTLFYVAVIASAALSITWVLLVRAAFHHLAPVDTRFAMPSKLALLILIGVVIVLLGLVPLLQGARTISGCVVTNNTLTGDCSGVGEVLAGGLLVLVGAIITLIGYIGALIGIWRFGTRYHNDLFKFGAVLLIFPLLNVLGAIMILVAAHTSRSRLGAPVGGPFGHP